MCIVMTSGSRCSNLWRVEFKREMQPLRNNPTLGQIKIFKDGSTKASEKESEGGSRRSNNKRHRISVCRNEEKESLAQAAIKEFLF